MDAARACERSGGITLLSPEMTTKGGAAVLAYPCLLGLDDLADRLRLTIASTASFFAMPVASFSASRFSRWLPGSWLVAEILGGGGEGFSSY